MNDNRCAYVGGPMRGYLNFNFPAFDAVTTMLSSKGEWDVFSPANHDRAVWPEVESAPGFAAGDMEIFDQHSPDDYTFDSLMRWDLDKVAFCDHLVLLPGWEFSHGARTERLVAEQTGSRIWLAYHSYGAGWYITLDPVQKRMGLATVEVWDPPVLHHRDPEPVLAGMRVEGEDIEALECLYAVTSAGSAKVSEALDLGHAFTTKDSGSRVAFDSGMVRDTDEGKPRYDLIPLAPLRRLAELYARGAVKYGDRNWQKANSPEELARFKASAFRHFVSWLNGETDEDHAIATVWNIFAAEWLAGSSR